MGLSGQLLRSQRAKSKNGTKVWSSGQATYTKAITGLLFDSVQERERVQSVPKVSQEQFHLYLFTEVLFHQLSYYIRENESSSHRSLPSHQSKYFGIDSSTSNRGLMKGTFETHVIFLASCLLLKTYESICGRYARHPDPSADPYAFSPVMNHRGPW